MKIIYFRFILSTTLLILICQNAMTAGTDDFVIRIKTDFPGTSTNNEFTIQTTGTGYNYNVDCDNDGNFEVTAQSGNYTCSYGGSGFKFIRIEDNNGDGTGFPRVYYNNTGDHRKLIDIVQWGTGIWTSMQGAFRGAQNMSVSTSDTPDLSAVTNLSSMFRFATVANPNTSLWDVSQVTTMHSMFRSATNANPDTSNWDTANVTTMKDMFRNANSADPDVTSWDVTGVTDMSLMFDNVTLPTATYDTLLVTFESQLLQNNVTLDGGNSKFCSLPAQIAHANLIADHIWAVNDGGLCNPSDPVNNFVFTVVTYNSGDPADASTFTIPTTGAGYNYNVDCNDDGSFEANGLTGSYVCDYSALGGPGTYTIRIEDGIGDGTGFPRVKFGQGLPEGLEIIELNNWGTGLWDSMESAFASTHLMQILANDAPDLSNVTDVSKMFSNAELANPDTSLWDTSNIFNMSQMFLGAWNANPDTSNWNTSNVTDMSFMFFQATIAQPNTSNWDTGEVKFMQGMFADVDLADPIASGWNIGNVSDMSDMFNATTLTTSNYDAMLINFASQSVQQGVNFHGGLSKYCAIAAHDALDQNDNWTITDGGINAFCPTAADDFVIAVKTDNLGTSNNTQFIIPTLGSGYNYNVDCDDDNPATNTATAITGDFTCNYVTAGTYTIRISDNVGDNTGFPRIYFNSQGDYRKITDLKHWGTGIWTNMASAFSGASNMLVTATDDPNLSQVVNAIGMFINASIANPNTTNWNVSTIEQMQSMFRNATSANPDTSGWNTSNVTSMFSMFNGATSANPNVQSWDITNVTNMSLMFDGVTLPQPSYDVLLAHFNSQMVNSSITFSGGNSTYCDIIAHDGLENTHGWIINDGGIAPACAYSSDDFIITVNTANTQPGSSSTTQFTIPITTHPVISGNYDYNVDCDLANVGTNIASGVTADYTCNYAAPGIYTLLISDNTGLKTGFPAFQALSNDDNLKIIELNQWGTGIWSTMATAFSYAENMVVNATDVPDLSMVANIGLMFSHAYLANPDVSNWNTSQVTGMSSVFFNATSANPDVSNWNTSQVTNMRLMFCGATAANPNVSNWMTSNVVTMYRMFDNASSANPNVNTWDTSSVTDMRLMFNGAVLANPSVGSWVTSSVTNMERLFTGASEANPDVSNWNTSSVTIMREMFEDASLANPNVSSWITTSVTDMREMFASASNANPDVSSWDTANVTNMSAMFRFATSANPDLSAWDVENVTNFNVMFLGVTLSLQNYDALLVNFSSQNLLSGRTFHGGNSSYCNVAAHDILENTFSWTISDGGLDAGCPSDVIFNNGFEEVVVFKSAASQFEYDFSKSALLDLDQQPLLIAQGINAIQLTVTEIYLRKDLGQLQIRKDYFDALDNVWVMGQWQSIDNTELTTVSWYK